MAANYIKKEDVSTDNIYEYNFDYEKGEFSGYWLKFKYVNVPMDTRDPFAPKQAGDAYAVYDCYLFDTSAEISGLYKEYTIDYYYVDKDTYDDLVEEDKMINDYPFLPYEVTDGIMTVNKFYIPDNFNIEDYKSEVYITQVDDTHEDYNINLFNIYKDPLTFGVEYTGHAVSSPSYVEGLNIITSKDYNRSIDWCKFYIDDTNHFKIDLYDGTNSSLLLWADIPQDFDFTADHTYMFTIETDTSDINNGIVRFVPKLEVDNILLNNILEDFGSPYYLEFDVSGGTTNAEAFMEQFLSNIWMFRYDPNSDNPSQDGYHAVGPNWEISQVKIFYMDGSSLLDHGDIQEHVLRAVSDKSLSDGTNEYTLEPMGTSEETQEEPTE